MSRNVYAHTAPGSLYPEFISVNQAGHDGYSVSVRNARKADDTCGDVASITLTSDQARSLALALLQDTTLDAG